MSTSTTSAPPVRAVPAPPRAPLGVLNHNRPALSALSAVGIKGHKIQPPAANVARPPALKTTPPPQTTAPSAAAAAQLEAEIARIETLLRTTDLAALPDKGRRLVTKANALRQDLQRARAAPTQLAIVASRQPISASSNAPPASSAPTLQVLTSVPANHPAARQPHRRRHPNSSTSTSSTSVQQARRNLGAHILALTKLDDARPPALTASTPQPHHPSQPPVVRTPLLPHQRDALAWLLWREHPDQPLRGGIMADDMGLGKTLSMLALIATPTTPTTTTLVVCPAGLMYHWADEVERHFLQHTLDVVVFHSQQRTLPQPDPTRRKPLLAVTSYSTLTAELAKNARSPLATTAWSRIVLDEGHLIKNRSTATFKTVAALGAPTTARWLVTGTPVQNNLKEV